MYKIISIIVLTTLSNSAIAEWTFVGKTDDLSSYANIATIRQHGDFVKMWDLYDFKTTHTAGQYMYLSTKKQTEYNCREEQYRTITSSGFSSNMGKGNEVISNNTAETWEPIPPDSVIEAFFKVACGLIKP